MPDIAALVDFVMRERAAADEEMQLGRVLTREALVALGRAIDGLFIHHRDRSTIALRCAGNGSRFRLGDRVTLVCEDYCLSALLVRLTQGGLHLEVQLGSRVGKIPLGPWTALEEGVDLSPSVIAALRRLEPGAPGYAFCRALFGEVAIPDRGSTPETDVLCSALRIAAARSWTHRNASPSAAAWHCRLRWASRGLREPARRWCSPSSLRLS